VSFKNGCPNPKCNAELDEMFYPKCDHCRFCGRSVRVKRKGFSVEYLEPNGLPHKCDKLDIPTWLDKWQRKRAEMLFEKYGAEFVELAKGREFQMLPANNPYASKLKLQGWKIVAEHGHGLVRPEGSEGFLTTEQWLKIKHGL
jgi:hypothetical protein